MPRRQRLVATLRWSGVPVVASRGGKFANASAERNTVSSKASVFGLLDEAPMTGLHYYYWLLASGGTLLDGFSVVSLGIAIPLLKQDMTITPVFVGLIGSALVLGQCSEQCWAGLRRIESAANTCSLRTWRLWSSGLCCVRWLTSLH